MGNIGTSCRLLKQLLKFHNAKTTNVVFSSLFNNEVFSHDATGIITLSCYGQGWCYGYLDKNAGYYKKSPFSVLSQHILSLPLWWTMSLEALMVILYEALPCPFALLLNLWCSTSLPQDFWKWQQENSAHDPFCTAETQALHSLRKYSIYFDFDALGFANLMFPPTSAGIHQIYSYTQKAHWKKKNQLECFPLFLCYGSSGEFPPGQCHTSRKCAHCQHLWGDFTDRIFNRMLRDLERITLFPRLLAQICSPIAAEHRYESMQLPKLFRKCHWSFF